VGDLYAPSVADGAKDVLLVVPPDSAHLDAVASTELPGSGGGDATVHEDQFESVGNAMKGLVVARVKAGWAETLPATCEDDSLVPLLPKAASAPRGNAAARSLAASRRRRIP
jgi:hypothetical protein